MIVFSIPRKNKKEMKKIQNKIKYMKKVTFLIPKLKKREMKFSIFPHNEEGICGLPMEAQNC